MPPPKPTLVLVMGVCGTGKSTLGAALTRSIGGVFIEGDDHHPTANIAKMRSGVPLGDEDRWAWLEALRDVAIDAIAQRSGPVIVACSALKRAYRQRLLTGINEPRIVVHLVADAPEIEAHLREREARGGHFMPTTLLASQLATLEAPTLTEPGISRLLTLAAFAPLAEQVAAVRRVIAAPNETPASEAR